MARFNVTVKHFRQRTEVVSRLKDFSNKVREESTIEVRELREEWDDDGNLTFSFVAMGFRISGAVVASDEDVNVSGEMPFAVVMFRGVIESQIADKLQEAIES